MEDFKYFWADKNNYTSELLLGFLIKVDDTFVIPLHERVALKEYAEKLAYNAENLFVIINDTVIASCSVYCNEKEAFISSIAVKSDYLRHGIATKMLELTFERAKQKECKILTLCVLKRNYAAIKFYLKNGFAIRKESEDEFIMERFL